MTLKIFKYPLQVRTENAISAPIVQPLHVDFQYGAANLWALVDTDAPSKLFKVLCYGTGEQAQFDTATTKYLNTTIVADGCLVFHWFFTEAKEV